MRLARLFALGCVTLACAGQRPPPTGTVAADASSSEVVVAIDAPTVTPIVDEEIDGGTCTPTYPKGSSESWRACPVAYACTLTPRSCCSPCGVPRACDLFAVVVSNEHLLRAKVCPEPMACPECESNENPQLHAACRNAKCEVIDVRNDALSACTSDDECIARVSHCCDPCEGGQPEIAIRKDAVVQYRQEVCGKVKCMNCKPKTWKAICHSTRKHCVIAATP